MAVRLRLAPKLEIIRLCLSAHPSAICALQFMTRILTNSASVLRKVVAEQLRDSLGGLKPKRIVLKPNWVLHETDSAFPIGALITDAKLIEATAEACLEMFPSTESILVADCPLQYADWPLMCEQSGLKPIKERLVKLSGGKI